jgi:hypothetical protein
MTRWAALAILLAFVLAASGFTPDEIASLRETGTVS